MRRLVLGLLAAAPVSTTFAGPVAWDKFQSDGLNHHNETSLALATTDPMERLAAQYSYGARSFSTASILSTQERLGRLQGRGEERSNIRRATPRSVPVPEPTSIGLLGLGILAIGLMRKRLKRP